MAEGNGLLLKPNQQHRRDFLHLCGIVASPFVFQVRYPDKCVFWDAESRGSTLWVVLEAWATATQLEAAILGSLSKEPFKGSLP